MQAVAGALLVRLALLAVPGATAACVVLVLWLTCCDLEQWSLYVLSDATFVALNVFLLYLYAAPLLSGTGKRSKLNWALSIIIAAIVLMYRPTAVFLLAPFAMLPALFAAMKRTRSLAPYVVGCLGLFIVAAFAHAALMRHPEIWPFRLARSYINVVAAEYPKGIVVDGRPSTYHMHPSSMVDFFFVTTHKFVAFFSFAAREFSPIHILLNMVWFVPVYVLAAVGCFEIARASIRHGRALVTLFLALAPLPLAIATALTILDYDWRYRAPILPHLVLLAGIGFSRLRDGNANVSLFSKWSPSR